MIISFIHHYLKKGDDYIANNKILKYGIKRGTCGVYMITNTVTNDFYIGSSIDIESRLSNHFNRDKRLYPDHSLYIAITNYPFECFKFEVLEECSPEDKIEREQYWYDKLHPTYNMVRPTENNFIYGSVREKSIAKSQTPEKIQLRKERYHTEQYQLLFRENTKYKMKSVNMIKDSVIIQTFECLQDAARYITQTTNYTGKNKASKIKAVCDGERPSAYGYQWEYNKM